jgi:hypothetical protein
MKGSPVTKGFAAKRGSTLASGTTCTSSLRIV